MPDTAKAELVAVLWEYSTILAKVVAVAIKQSEVRDRFVLEWMVDDYLASKVAAVTITNATAQEIANILSEYLSQEVDEALSTAPPRPRPATTPAMPADEAAANRRRLTGN